MSIFSSDKPLRTPRQVQEDPKIGEGYVVVPDSVRSDYEANGYKLAEDLAGSNCLMQKKES